MAITDDDKKTEAVPEVPDVSAAKKASIIKWAIVGAILLLFLGMQVAMSIFFTSKLNPAPVNIQDEEAKRQEEFLKAQKEVGVTLAAPIEVTVNISGEDGRFIKCGVQLEYSPSYIKLGDELEARKARVKNIVIDILSSRTLSELMSNEGKASVREQIVTDINNILPENDDKGKTLGKVSRSYFDSFMIQ
jgi:flagellar FliL protein